MRLLREEHQDRIISRVTSLLSHSGLLFNSVNVQIITGLEEAIYGWLAVNYFFQGFPLDKKAAPANVETLGISYWGYGRAQARSVDSALRFHLQSSITHCLVRLSLCFPGRLP